MCVCGWMSETEFELSSRRVVLAGCSLCRLLVNFDNTWTKQKGHILNPPINTEAEHAIQRLLTYCGSTHWLFRLGRNRSLGAKNKGSQKEVAVSERRRGQERRQQRSRLEVRENPGDQSCMYTSECQRMPRDPGQQCPRLVTTRRCT